MRRSVGPFFGLCTVARQGCLPEPVSVVPMGACGTKQLSGSRELGVSPRGQQRKPQSKASPPQHTVTHLNNGDVSLVSLMLHYLCNSAQSVCSDDETSAGTTESTESRDVTRPTTKDSADSLVSVRENTSHTRPRKNKTSRGAKVFLRQQQHHRNVSELIGVRVCGLQTLTVPESQPYLAQTVHSSLLGRFYRPRDVGCELNMKLSVMGEGSPWILGTPGDSGLGSKQNSLPGLSNAPKLSDPPDGGTTVVGASPESSRSDNNPDQCDDKERTSVVQPHCKIENPKWEERPEPSTYVLPLSPEGSSPPTPLSMSPILKRGKTRILCISTVSPDLPELNFEEKAVQITGADSPLALEKLGVSVVCKKGYKPNCPNNDGFFVSHVRGCTVCCVLDGHGPFGHEICHAVQQDLLKLTTGNPDLPVRSRSVLQEAFLRAHSNLQTKCNAFSLDSKISGTTVTILVYLREQNKLFVAHVGNSRAVLCKFNRYGCGVRAVDLTVDHTLTNNKELRRIVKAGGQVRALAGDGFHRIFLTNGRLPGLAVARSIGDTLAGSAGVIALPEIKEYKIDAKRDKFLLLCTDGIWNVVSSQEAVEIAHSAKQRGVRKNAYIPRVAGKLYQALRDLLTEIPHYLCTTVVNIS